MSNIRIVVDSACDVPAEYVQRYQMLVIPAYIHFGVDESLKDDIDISREAFYQRLPESNPLPTTSAYSPGEAETVLRQALEDAEHVIAVHTSGKLSAMVESTRVAAKTIGENRITVWDGKSVSMGGGMQAIAAAEAAAAGKSREDILALLQDIQTRFKLYAAPSTMEYLRRSGRVSALVAGLGEMLQIKPLIEVSTGEAESAGRIRTFRKVKEKLVEMAHDLAPLEQLTVLHINNPEGAAELHAALQDIAPPDHTYVVMASAAIGANFGPGGLGFAAISKPST